MNDQKGQSGGCLCGKVRFQLSEPVHEVGVCHCSMCRRWSGGPAFAIEGGKGMEIGKGLTFEGEENIATYRSSDWGERAFCSNCGSNLFYRLVDSGQIILFAGALDDQSGLTLTSQIFVDEKPDYYDFANETKMMTGAEVFAMYAPPETKGS